MTLDSGVVATLIAVFICVLAAARAYSTKPRSLEHLPRASDDVIALAKSGKKVAAIKQYRRDTKATLMEASNVINQYI